LEEPVEVTVSLTYSQAIALWGTETDFGRVDGNVASAIEKLIAPAAEEAILKHGAQIAHFAKETEVMAGAGVKFPKPGRNA